MKTNYFDPKSIVKNDGLTSLSFNIPLEIFKKAHKEESSVNPKHLLMYIVAFSTFKNKQQKFVLMQKGYGLCKSTKGKDGIDHFKLNKTKFAPQSHDGLKIDFFDFMTIFKEYFQTEQSKDFINHIKSFIESEFVLDKDERLDDILSGDISYKKLKEATKSKSVWVKVKSHDQLGIPKILNKAWYHLTVPVFSDNRNNLNMANFTKLLIVILATKPEAIGTKKKHTKESYEGLTHQSIANMLGVQQPYVTMVLSDFEKLYVFKETDTLTHSKALYDFSQGVSGYAFHTHKFLKTQTLDQMTGEITQQKESSYYRLVGTKVLDNLGFNFCVTTKLKDNRTGKIFNKKVSKIGKRKYKVGALRFIEHLNKNEMKKNSSGLRNLNNLMVSSKRSGASLDTQSETDFKRLKNEMTVPGIKGNQKDIYYGIRGNNYKKSALILKLLKSFNEVTKSIEAYHQKSAKSFIDKAFYISFNQFKKSVTYMAYDLKHNDDTYKNDFIKEQVISNLWILNKVMTEMKSSELFDFDPKNETLSDVLDCDIKNNKIDYSKVKIVFKKKYTFNYNYYNDILNADTLNKQINSSFNINDLPSLRSGNGVNPSLRSGIDVHEIFILDLSDLNFLSFSSSNFYSSLKSNDYKANNKM